MVARNRTHKVILILVAVISLFCAVGFVVFSMMSRTNPEISDDINRHFDSIAHETPMTGDDKIDEGSDSPVDDRVYKDRAKLSSDRKVDSRRPRRPRYRMATSKRRAKPPSSSREANSRFKGIVKVAPRTYLIDRSLVNRAQKSPQQFIGGVRAVVYKENQKPAGFKLKRISAGNVLRAIGLRNGDILTSINGHPLRGVEQALFAAAAVGSKKQFRLDILRKNSRRTLYYRVQ